MADILVVKNFHGHEFSPFVMLRIKILLKEEEVVQWCWLYICVCIYIYYLYSNM